MSKMEKNIRSLYVVQATLKIRHSGGKTDKIYNFISSEEETHEQVMAKIKSEINDDANFGTCVTRIVVLGVYPIN